MATTGTKAQTTARDRDLTGRVALVTGGTRGIGAAICHALAADGAVVAAGYSSNQARADQLRQAIEADGGTLSLHQGNIGDADDCARVVNDVISQHGRLDILVNNAGITVDKAVFEDVGDRLGQGGAGRPIGSVLHGQAGARRHDQAAARAESSTSRR